MKNRQSTSSKKATLFEVTLSIVVEVFVLLFPIASINPKIKAFE